MAALFLLFSLAYLLACSGLAVYALLGLCLRPLARSSSFAAGRWILTVLLLLAAALVGGLFAFAALRFGNAARWHALLSLRRGAEMLPLLLVILLPFSLLRPTVYRRLAAVLGVACLCVLCYGWFFLLTSSAA